ncbi:MAG: ABC transporter [Gemmatimonadetes bacterium]|nr:MAG: ABC transporter [Gemmatimonadota bacterium]
MRNIIAICKREVKSYFSSPIAYIVIVVFLLLVGGFFSTGLFLNGQAEMRSSMALVPLVFTFFIPAITMGLISEERKSGTLEMLVTMPIRDYEIILGKFFAASILLTITILLTVIHPITLMMLGDVDLGQIFSLYLGLILMGISFVAVGLFGSSLARNQIVAFIISFAILFIIFLMDKYIIVFVPTFMANLIEYLGADYHFSNIARGVIDLRDLVYYFSMIFLSLYLANYMLESRKWR